MKHGFKRHPLSAAWGDMPEALLLELAEDIREHGQKEAVVMFDGMVLDGWHRCQACQIAGVDVRTKEYHGDNPVAYVISKNAHRRSQTASQRAAAVVMCHEWRPAHRPKTVQRTNKSVPGTELFAQRTNAASTQQMADEAGVGASTIERAKTAVSAGLGGKVVNGEMSVKAAAKAARAEPKTPPPPTPLEKARARIAELEAALAQRDEVIRELTDALESDEDAKLGDAEQKVKFEQLRQEKRALESQLREKTGLLNEWKKEALASRKKLGAR